eukprot:XP_011668782.1 PREDICTED: uncharacterized protein LOC105440400 [Strongylocentrotus purpuratus]
MDQSILRGRRKRPTPLVTCEDGQASRDDDGPIPGLQVKDTLTVVTPSGECKIELCLGDITKLPQKDKVDVLLISAYGGCYSKGVGVMGALYRQRDIDVYQLARTHKEEDLQDLYSCWWTKPLPNHLPYKRLLCFETRGSTVFSGASYDTKWGEGQMDTPLNKVKYREVTGEVLLSFHPHDEKFALSFKSLLEWTAPKVVVLVDASSDQERLRQLDNARHIVAFLSPHYVESPKHVEEFHVALWRQRVSPIQAPLLLPVKVSKLIPGGCFNWTVFVLWCSVHPTEEILV